MDAQNQWEEGTLGRISPSAFFPQGSCTPGDLYRTITRTPALFQLIFEWILLPFPTARLANVSKTQKSAARRDLDWSAESARLLFDGDDAVLYNRFRTPSRRGHRLLPAAAARFLCGRTLIFVPKVFIHDIIKVNHDIVYVAHPGIERTFDLISPGYWWLGMWKSKINIHFCTDMEKAGTSHTPKNGSSHPRVRATAVQGNKSCLLHLITRNGNTNYWEKCRGVRVTSGGT